MLPDCQATIFEGEAEMGLVIGKTASKVKAEDAYDYIFGYTNFIDVSARGFRPENRGELLLGQDMGHIRPHGAGHCHG